MQQQKLNTSKQDIINMVDSLKEEYNDEKYNLYFKEAKEELLLNIIKPFGLAKILFDDRDGGNVTTIHNANKNIYAKDSDKYNRDDYDSSPNTQGNTFKGTSKKSVGSNYTKSKLNNHNEIVDEYTGKLELGSNTSPDHITSLSQYHKDGGYMQSTTEKADFATDTDNLAVTNRSINHSMRDYDKKEWMKKSREDGSLNEEHYKIDKVKMDKQLKQSKDAVNNHKVTNLEKANYYTKNIGLTGLKDGVKMGFQQALGLFIYELVQALLVQAKDIYQNSFKKNIDDTFLKTIKDRFTEISTQVWLRHRDILMAFKDGAVSGFISNLTTVIINTFMTTAKRVARFIREGMSSLKNAIKVVTNPPHSMSKSQTYHEATKIIVAGLMTGGGIAIEEPINKFLTSNLHFLENVMGVNINEVLSTLFVGTIVTIFTGLVIFIIDKHDYFGAEKQVQFEYVMNKLNFSKY